MSNSIDFGTRWRLRGSNMLAAIGLDGRVHLGLTQEEDGQTRVAVDGRRLAIPAPQRWPLYKRGLARRQQRLMTNYGVGDKIVLRPGDQVVEVGANIGELSLALADHGARVLAIEGDPAVFRCLVENTASEPDITCLNEVIWKEPGLLTFYSEPNEANSSVFRSNEGAPPTAMQVRATTLDLVAERLGLGDVTFLKCDAEGAEPEVIEGGRNLLMRTRSVAFETSSERMGQTTTDACSALLLDLGFGVQFERRLGRHMTFGFRR